MSGTPLQPNPSDRSTPSPSDSPENRRAQQDDRHALADAFVQVDDGQRPGKSFVETEHTDPKDLKGSRRHLGWLWAAIAIVLVGLLILSWAGYPGTNGIRR